MKFFIFFYLFGLVICFSGKQRYCQTIAHEKLYPEVDIVRFCNIYVTKIGSNYCCIKENNQDDVLQHTCLPINRFTFGPENIGTLKPQTYRTKPPLTMQHVSTHRMPDYRVSSTTAMPLSSMVMPTEDFQQMPIDVSDGLQTVSPTLAPTFGQNVEIVGQMPPTSDESNGETDFDQESSSSKAFGEPIYTSTEINNSFDGNNVEIARFTSNWVNRFERSIQQATHTIGNEQQDVIVALFRESIQQFISEFKDRHNIVCPVSDSLNSDSTTFVKTPFDFTLQNIWNAMFYTNEWNPKFTLPNFMIDQQTGILVTVLATLLAAFCDKTTRDRLALLTDELGQITCIENFCCPSLFHLLKLIFRRAKYPPPRKILKKKLKHLPKKPFDETNIEEGNVDEKGKKKTEGNKNRDKYQKLKKGKKSQQRFRVRAVYKKREQPETHIEIVNEHSENCSNNKNDLKNSHDTQHMSSVSSRNKPKPTDQPDFDRITVVANVHKTSNSNLSYKSMC